LKLTTKVPPYANKYLGNERKSGISKARGVISMKRDVGDEKRGRD